MSRTRIALAFHIQRLQLCRKNRLYLFKRSVLLSHKPFMLLCKQKRIVDLKDVEAETKRMLYVWYLAQSSQTQYKIFLFGLLKSAKHIIVNFFSLFNSFSIAHIAQHKSIYFGLMLKYQLQTSIRQIQVGTSMDGCQQFSWFFGFLCFLEVVDGLVDGPFMRFVGVLKMTFLGGRVLSQSDQVVRLDHSCDLIVVLCCEWRVSFVALDFYHTVFITPSHTLFLVKIIRTQVTDCFLVKPQKRFQGHLLRKSIKSLLTIVEIAN